MRVIEAPTPIESPDGPAFEFLCDEGRVRVTCLSSNIIRVQATREETYRRYESFATVGYSNPPSVEFFEQDGQWSISLPTSLLLVERDPFRLILKNLDGATIFEDSRAGGIEWRENGFVIRRTMLGPEVFYGLGEKAYGLDKRGIRYEMWTTDNPDYGFHSDPLYQSIPFFLVLNRGIVHGIFLDNSYRTFFDFQQEAEYSFGSVGGPLDYYLILGPSFEEVLDSYTRLTGRPHFVPLWALGHQHSRWMVYESQEDILSIANRYRDHNLPCDTIVLDIAYMDEYRIFTWDPKVFPKPHEFTDALTKLGFHVMAIIDPGVKLEEGFSVYDDGLKQNMFLQQDDGSVYVGLVWPGETVFPDFSRPEVREWFASKYLLLSSSGLSNSSWIDMNEPSNCIYEGLRDEYSMKHVVDSAGELWEERLRNVYALGMCEAAFNGIRKVHSGKRPFILTRSGFAGYQRYAATWTGDNKSTWNHLRLSIPMLLGLGLSGIPICGADVGGFSDDVTGELLVRWYQVGCFYPFFRNHSRINTARQEPWLFGNEYESIIRDAINLRYKLLRYFYSLAWDSSQTGRPIMRPLAMEFADDPKIYSLDTQFMVGPFIMVAPVLEEGAISREVYLPQGTWYSFQDHAIIHGPTTITVNAAIDQIPIFIRGGAIIPTGRVVQHTGDDLGNLVLWIYAHGHSDFILYEDDGISDSGPSSTVHFVVDSQDGTFTLGIGARNGTWKPPPRSLIIHVFGVEASSRVLFDGRVIDGSITEDGTVTITYPDDGMEHQLTIISS
ncbi:MAG: glycoside hydrolase family 31 protein [Candidatus Thorarchaeota archaeon]|nr:glycoside hydrolase family 31 protein [Candidatus Thorarchaeota archaeon]